MKILKISACGDHVWSRAAARRKSWCSRVFLLFSTNFPFYPTRLVSWNDFLGPQACLFETDFSGRRLAATRPGEGVPPRRRVPAWRATIPPGAQGSRGRAPCFARGTRATIPRNPQANRPGGHGQTFRYNYLAVPNYSLFMFLFFLLLLNYSASFMSNFSAPF